MNPIKTQIAQLAFQADRRILSLEEESHIRLDLSAHERAAFFVTPRAVSKSMTLNLPNLSWFKDYAFLSVMLFTLMFLISNLPSYAKLSMASITEANTAYLDGMNIEEGILLSEDLWTGDKIGTTVPLLTAKDETVLRPDDGILPLAPTPSSIEDRISIPSLDVNSPLIAPELGLEALQDKDWNELEETIRDSLLSGVVHYPGTANPGKKGNFFVTGHSSNVFWEQSSFNTVFARLPQIEIGSEIIVTQDQVEYTYIVTETKEVSPKDVSVLSQGDGYQMTLMTCTPVGTTINRLVVTAELKQ